MAALPPNMFLTAGSPHDAAVQLLYKLPGKYQLIRKTHHASVVNGTNLAYQHLLSPSHGTSEIILRGSTDPIYEVELIQTTTIELRTRYHQSATKIEKRAFRITNGQWSIWAVQTVVGFDSVAHKLTDLIMSEVAAPKQTGPTVRDVVQTAGLRGGPWMVGPEANVVGMCVWLGKQSCWQLMHQINQQMAGTTEVCNDEFWPVAEGGGLA